MFPLPKETDKQIQQCRIAEEHHEPLETLIGVRGQDRGEGSQPKKGQHSWTNAQPRIGQRSSHEVPRQVKPQQKEDHETDAHHRKVGRPAFE